MANSNNIRPWNTNKHYRVGEQVEYDSKTWRNKRGLNGTPGVGDDWGLTGSELAIGTINYSSIKPPQVFYPTAPEIVSETAVFALSGSEPVSFITINGQTISGAEYIATGNSVTVSPANGFNSIADEVLVFQATFSVVSIKPHGIFDYNDLATATTPLAITGGAGFTYLPNDELGPFTNKNYPPSGVTDVWDADNDEFDFSQLPLGTKVTMRLDLQITTSSPNQNVDVRIDLGIGMFLYTLNWEEKLYKTAAAHNFVVSSFVYIGDTNTLNGKAKFKIASDADCDVQVNGWACSVIMY